MTYKSQGGFLSIVLILILLIAIPIGIYLVLNPTIFKSKADFEGNEIIRASMTSGSVESKISSATEGNAQGSYETAISDDGRYVVFNSSSSDLVQNDTNGVNDIFLKDLKTNVITRVSTDKNGNQADGESLTPFVSGDGTYVAFSSIAGNLVPGDSGGVYNIYLKNTKTGDVQRITNGLNNKPPNGNSNYAWMSRDGRYTCYSSDAQNLLPNITNGHRNVFLYDAVLKTTLLISKSDTNELGNNDSLQCAVSDDGRIVTFDSTASNLVPNDSNLGKVGTDMKGWDVFAFDVSTGKTQLISVNNQGQQGNLDSNVPTITADGRYIQYGSLADNLVSGDTNRYWDTFVYDRVNKNVLRVSQTSEGRQAEGGNSYDAQISSDGRFVAYESYANNIVENDLNNHVDVFLYNMITHVTKKITVGGGGSAPRISSNGIIAFQSEVSDLVGDDTNGFWDIFVALPGKAAGIDSSPKPIASLLSADYNGCNNNNPQINLSWNPVDSASGYEIFRSDNQNHIALVDGSKTAYVDSAEKLSSDTPYKYWIYALNTPFGNVKSNIVELRTQNCSGQQEFTLRADSSCQIDLPVVNLSWTSLPNVIGFMVTRNDLPVTINVDGSKSAATDIKNALQSDKDYTYFVTAQVGFTGETKKSNIVTTHTPKCTDMNTPAVVIDSNNCDDESHLPVVKISWTVVKDAVSYNVYRSDLNQPFNQTSNKAFLTDIKNSLKDDTDYTYKVSAVKADGAQFFSLPQMVKTKICSNP